MEHKNQLNSASTGTVVGMSPKAIEVKLAQLRQESARGPLHPSEHPPARATVLNLITYASGSKLAEKIASVVKELIGRYPSRAILLMANLESNNPAINSQVSVHCDLQESGERQVCLEQVLISASGPSISQMPSLTLPLLIPGLPVFLWWPGEPPFQGDTFDLLVDSCDRLIVDSSDFQHTGALTALASMMTGRHSRCALGDLNWSRLTPWRELLAQFFDAPNLLPYIAHLDRITLEYVASNGTAVLPKVLLLIGWLASRLGWEPVAEAPQIKEQGFHLQMSRADNPIAIEVRSDTPLGVGGLISVKLSATRAEPSATFTIARAKDSGCASTTVELEGTNPLTRITPMASFSDGQLLARELERAGCDRIYEEALQVAGFLASRLAEATGN